MENFRVKVFFFFTTTGAGAVAVSFAGWLGLVAAVLGVLKVRRCTWKVGSLKHRDDKIRPGCHHGGELPIRPPTTVRRVVHGEGDTAAIALCGKVGWGFPIAEKKQTKYREGQWAKESPCRAHDKHPKKECLG